MKKSLPIQPIVDGRFVPNKVVQYLLDNGGIDMNKIAVQGFPKEDQEQFAQLIGYSLSGYGDLSYVSDESYCAAEEMGDNELITYYEARINALEKTLKETRDGIKNAVSALFDIHPDDLESR